jgi:fructose 1,6-bisphosphate aldolase/phosphatase
LWQGFAGAAMLPYSELEYGGIVKKMEKLEPRFKVKKEVKAGKKK